MKRGQAGATVSQWLLWIFFLIVAIAAIYAISKLT